jgi:hypothetical protein
MLTGTEALASYGPPLYSAGGRLQFVQFRTYSGQGVRELPLQILNKLLTHLTP